MNFTIFSIYIHNRYSIENIKLYFFRTLSFWRALTAECISSFFYVLLISCITKSSSSSSASKKGESTSLDPLHIQVIKTWKFDAALLLFTFKC